MSQLCCDERIPAPPEDQFNFALQALCEQTMHFVIAFDGHLDVTRLLTACAQTLALVPLLGCRFVEAPAPYWERITPLDPRELVRIHPASGSDDDLQHILALPCDPATRPPIRFDILRDKTRDTLCITVHHAVMDAHGLILYAGLLAGCYRDPKMACGTVPSTCPDRSLTGILSRFPGVAPVPETVMPEPHYTRWVFPAPAGTCTQRAFAIRTLPPTRLPEIRRAAKAHGATVNDVILAAFFSALCDAIQPEPGLLVPIMLSIDLRRYLNGSSGGQKSAMGGSENSVTFDALVTLVSKNIANLSVAFIVMLPTGIPSMDARIAAATAAMRVHKTNNPGIASAIDVESFGLANYPGILDRVQMINEEAVKNGTNVPFLGNIGIIPDAATAFSPDLPVKNAFLVGIVLNPPGIALGVTTFCDQMTLSIGYGSTTIPRAQMDGFLDTVVQYLPGA